MILNTMQFINLTFYRLSDIALNALKRWYLHGIGINMKSTTFIYRNANMAEIHVYKNDLYIKVVLCTIFIENIGNCYILQKIAVYDEWQMNEMLSARNKEYKLSKYKKDTLFVFPKCQIHQNQTLWYSFFLLLKQYLRWN